MPGKTVLVADDTAFVRDRFKEAIERAGHRAVIVKSAPELLARVRSDLGRLDLLILDLRLPHARGVDVVRAIRRMDAGRVPILIFSGTIGGADEVRELAALGVNGYINEYSSVEHILPSLAPHLFPDNFNRRASPRVMLGVPVAYQVGNTVAGALTLNVSRGGLAIRTTSLLDTGTRLHLRLRLPGGRAEIHLDARVAWTDRRVGMGLQFETIAPEDQAAINAFVDAHFFSNRKA